MKNYSDKEIINATIIDYLMQNGMLHVMLRIGKENISLYVNKGRSDMNCVAFHAGDRGSTLLDESLAKRLYVRFFYLWEDK